MQCCIGVFMVAVDITEYCMQCCIEVFMVAVDITEYYMQCCIGVFMVAVDITGLTSKAQSMSRTRLGLSRTIFSNRITNLPRRKYNLYLYDTFISFSLTGHGVEGPVVLHSTCIWHCSKVMLSMWCICPTGGGGTKLENTDLSKEDWL